MERSKIPFKYLMNLWKHLPGYPTGEDVVYELSVYLMKDGRPNGEFSHQTYNSAFGPDWESTKHKEVLDNLVKNEVFEETNKSTPAKKWYRIKQNPFYQ